MLVLVKEKEVQSKEKIIERNRIEEIEQEKQRLYDIQKMKEFESNKIIQKFLEQQMNQKTRVEKEKVELEIKNLAQNNQMRKQTEEKLKTEKQKNMLLYQNLKNSYLLI